MGQLAGRGPRQLSACTLLDRPMRRIVPHELRYRGLELDDEFVLGYGLHAHDLYRNLPFIVTGERDVIAGRPDAYVDDVYRGGLRLLGGSGDREGSTEASGMVTDG
jgi:hypothetical protein